MRHPIRVLVTLLATLLLAVVVVAGLGAKAHAHVVQQTTMTIGVDAWWIVGIATVLALFGFVFYILRK